jgi:hypothetical protein
MEPVNGFLSSDKQFFLSADACREHEAEVARLSDITDRSRAILEIFSTGMILSRDSLNRSDLPEALRQHLADIPEDDIENLWNNYLVALFTSEEESEREGSISRVLYEIPASGGTRKSSAREFFLLKLETSYELLAFVLGKPV